MKVASELMWSSCSSATVWLAHQLAGLGIEFILWLSIQLKWYIDHFFPLAVLGCHIEGWCGLKGYLPVTPAVEKGNDHLCTPKSTSVTQLSWFKFSDPRAIYLVADVREIDYSWAFPWDALVIRILFGKRSLKRFYYRMRKNIGCYFFSATCFFPLFLLFCFCFHFVKTV